MSGNLDKPSCDLLIDLFFSHRLAILLSRHGAGEMEIARIPANIQSVFQIGGLGRDRPADGAGRFMEPKSLISPPSRQT